MCVLLTFVIDHILEMYKFFCGIIFGIVLFGSTKNFTSLFWSFPIICFSSVLKRVVYNCSVALNSI